ncbi:tyrosine-type recombinase/integrase [Umezawaea sp. Da 62-37]|uniref:tyrosine-type recombinase/integrase n=1 Tax=Umezawaea sp. Da 62-37 TaxID=3075927 RepID=UPI0028F6FD9F|nr:tyrosine-type recombinase/integrase [Umezawaea sp. Da 62-37]WNV83191.1 tyrosine-type recombinase/integrase [Umezawaea sp. Da 62-37]
MTRRKKDPAARDQQGFETLKSGALRVRVYAGRDPITRKEIWLRETVPAGDDAWDRARRVRTRLLHQVDEGKASKSSLTNQQLLELYLTPGRVEGTTLDGYIRKAKTHIYPLIGKEQISKTTNRTLNKFYAELLRCRMHCTPLEVNIDHRTRMKHECDSRCTPHECSPLSASSIRQMHFCLSGAYKWAMQQDENWLSENPAELASPPPAVNPEPDPPTPEEAARIINECWSDPIFGPFVWIAMCTGARRGENCAHRWNKIVKRHKKELHDTEHKCSEVGCEWQLEINRSIAQVGKKTWEKPTKTNQRRFIILDNESIAVLEDYRNYCEARAAAFGMTLKDDGYIFSDSPDGSKYLIPSTVSQKYERLVEQLGIKTLLKALRHYNVTELIAAGVDIRTIAGRVGHAGGGTTTMRVYAAFTNAADQRAAKKLGDHLPPRPTGRAEKKRDPYPFELVAAEYRTLIKSGHFGPENPFPTTVELAQEKFVSAGTANRAIGILKEEGLISAGRGIRTRVLWSSSNSDEATTPPAATEPPARISTIEHKPNILQTQASTPLVELDILHLGSPFRKITASVAPDDLDKIRQLLADAMRRRRIDESEIGDFEVDIRLPGDATILSTFATSPVPDRTVDDNVRRLPVGRAEPAAS